MAIQTKYHTNQYTNIFTFQKKKNTVTLIGLLVNTVTMFYIWSNFFENRRIFTHILPLKEGFVPKWGRIDLVRMDL